MADEMTDEQMVDALALASYMENEEDVEVHRSRLLAELARLRGEVARLSEALKPFGKSVQVHSAEPRSARIECIFEAGAFHDARAALAAPGPGERAGEDGR